MKRFKSRRTESSLINHVILALLAAFAVIPIIVLFMNAFKTTPEIAASPFAFPTDPRFANFIEAFERGNYATTTLNSIILTTGTVIGTLLAAGLAGYALAHLNLRWSNAIAFYFLVGTAIPPQLYMVPLFFMWRIFGLLESHLGLIIIYCATSSPFATYLIRSYMIALPKDFIEAARIDGATNIQVLRHVILPLSWPGFLTAGLIVGLGVWNEFLFAITFLHHPDLKPISTSLFAFQARFSTDWGLTNAASVMMMFPVLILFLLMQRRFIEGLTQGGLKA
ncbi:carbohydrate ABC transporter permease [Chloroflexi bacterium TSY]|nr:carbohydrate ABC transporter permease [Chloroflexi bacterium TSY]